MDSESIYQNGEKEELLVGIMLRAGVGATKLVRIYLAWSQESLWIVPTDKSASISFGRPNVRISSLHNRECARVGFGVSRDTIVPTFQIELIPRSSTGEEAQYVLSTLLSVFELIEQ